MSEKHLCVQQVDENIDGLDAEFEIKEDGSVEICFRDSEGMDGCIFWRFKFCPFCGWHFEEEVSAELAEHRRNCKCNNTYHGVCIDCGRSTQ